MHRISCWLALFGVAFVVAPSAAPAAPITVPTDLHPGDQYCLAFVTSTARDALSANIGDYNAFVTSITNTVPELVALGTSWKAIGSTATVDARDNTGTNPANVGVPIYRLDDMRIADNNADLWDATLAEPIDTSEFGETLNPTVVWTGSNWDGLSFQAWALGGTSGLSEFGMSSTLYQGWVNSGVNLSSQEASFYAMSDVLTVVPEPSTMALALLGMTGLVVSVYRRRRPSKT
jgi:hypothetical protein